MAPIQEKCSEENLHKNVYSSFIHDVPKWENIRCPPIAEWISRGLSYSGAQHSHTNGTDYHWGNARMNLKIV